MCVSSLLKDEKHISLLTFPLKGSSISAYFIKCITFNLKVTLERLKNV